MNKMLQEVLNADIGRYGGATSLKRKIFPTRELKYIRLFHKATMSRNRLARYYYVWRLMNYSWKVHIQISRKTQIGKGFYIGLFGRIVINGEAVIGEYCNISPGCVIGQENRGDRKGAPTIGNRVFMGANSIIVGKITIGDDVLIAPNAFVNCDVPSHSVVIGNPARVFHRDNATEGYIYCPS